MIRSWWGRWQMSYYDRLRTAETENTHWMGMITQLVEVIDQLDRKDLIIHTAHDFWKKQVAAEGAYRQVIQRLRSL